MSKSESVDVAIIGSGAGGGPVAFKLAQLGFKVVVLEKGDWIPRDQNPEDELAELFLEKHRPNESDDPTLVYSDAQLASGASRVGQSFYLVGGGTVRYTATSWRLRPQDFKKKSTYGNVEGTSLVDWPLKYEDLEPYYTEAEKLIGISGKSGVDPTEPFRSQDHLLPPLKEDRFQQILVETTKKMGLKPFPIPVAIHSEASGERGTAMCMQCGWCSGFPCRFFAKSSMDVVVYPRLKSKTTFTLKTNSYVSRLVLDKETQKINSIEYKNLKTGQNETLQAKVVIVAASAIQTARLLLQSEVGNASGELGRNLMFHIEAKASAVFENEKFHQAYYKKVGIHDFYFPKKSDSFINHRSIQSGSKAPPIAFSLSKKGYGKDFAKNIAANFLKTQELQCMVEDLPQSTNRVTLSNEKKDAWGFAAPEIHHKYHDQDRKAVSAALEKMRGILEAAGGKNIETPAEPPKNITDRYTWHLLGTTRMGTDPAKSVVNPEGRLHDVKNLFVADGGVFPTSGGLNPTLTIQALALRLGDHVASALKEGKL